MVKCCCHRYILAMVGVSFHRPGRRFTRVILPQRASGSDRTEFQFPSCDHGLEIHPTEPHMLRIRLAQIPIDELQQTEFSCPADRPAAVLNAELAVHGTLVGLHGIERDV